MVLNNLTYCRRTVLLRHRFVQMRRMSSNLSISLPDLSDTEKAFIKEQSSICIRPSVLQPDPQNDQENNDSLRRSYERIFPPTAEMRHLYAGARVIQKNCSYNLYRVPRSQTDRFARHAKSTVALERTGKALRFCKVRNDELLKNPLLVLNTPSSILSDHLTSQMCDISLNEVKTYRRKGHLRGRVIKAYVAKVISSLDTLGLHLEAELVRDLEWAGKENVTLHQMSLIISEILVRNVIHRLYPEAGRGFVEAENARVKRKIVVDPIAMARNCYLFQHTVKGGCVPSAKMVTNVTNICPIEGLVTLNSYYDYLTGGNLGLDMTPDHFLEQFVDNKMLRLIYSPSRRLPVGIKAKIYTDIGFQQDELECLLMSSKVMSDNSGEPKYTSGVRFVDTMKARLDILRKDGLKLCLNKPDEMMTAMTMWTDVMRSIKSIVDENLQDSTLVSIFQARKLVIKPRCESSVKCPAKMFLEKYLGSDSQETSELVKELFKSKGFGNVEAKRIEETLKCLTDRKFTKEQIKKALPLLFYPKTIVEQKLEEVPHMPEMQPWQEQKECDMSNPDNGLLNVVLFLVEKEFNFTPEGIYTGSSNDFSPELYQELDKLDLDEEEDSSNELSVKQEIIHAVKIPSKNSSPVHHPVLSAMGQSVRLLSTESNIGQQRRDFSNTKGHVFFLQNPFKWLRIQSEFAKLKQEWDPQFDQGEFLEGTKQALSTVTSLLATNSFDDLKGLLSIKARIKLRKEIEKNWTDQQRNNCDLEMEEILKVVPTRVYTHSVAYEKYADIGVFFVALRQPRRSGDPSIDVRISATFSRNYTKGQLPSWNIVQFDIVNFSPINIEDKK